MTRRPSRFVSTLTRSDCVHECTCELRLRASTKQFLAIQLAAPFI